MSRPVLALGHMGKFDMIGDNTAMQNSTPHTVTCTCPHCRRSTRHLLVPSVDETLAWCQNCDRIHFIPMRLELPQLSMPDLVLAAE